MFSGEIYEIFKNTSRGCFCISRFWRNSSLCRKFNPIVFDFRHVHQLISFDKTLYWYVSLLEVIGKYFVVVTGNILSLLNVSSILIFLSISETYSFWFYEMHSTIATDAWYFIVFYTVNHGSLKHSYSYQRSDKWKGVFSYTPHILY